MGQQKTRQLAAGIHKSAAWVLQEEFPGEYVTVTGVEVSPDATAATVWISIFNDTRRDELFRHARTLEGTVRTRVAGDIRIRKVPEVTLKLDEREQHAQAVEDTLRELQEGTSDYREDQATN